MMSISTAERRLLFALLAWKALSLAVVLVAHSAFAIDDVTLLQRHNTSFTGPVVDGPRAWLSVWDAQHYLHLARDGYVAWDQSIVFPFVWPLVVRGAAPLFFGDHFAAGLVLANALSLLGALWLHRWARTLAPGEHAERTATAGVLLLFLSPTAFVFSVPYAEALFLAAAAGTLFFLSRSAEAQRMLSSLVAVGLLGALATATKNIGVVLIVPVVVVAWQRRSPIILVAALPIAAAFFAHRVFLSWTLGDPAMYDEIQRRWVAAPSPAKVFDVPQFISALFSADRIHNVRTSMLDRAAFVLSIAASIALVRRDKPSGAYSAIALYVSAATTSFISFGRYVLAGFPIFVWLAFALEAKPRARIALLCAFAALQLWFFVRFTAWQWVG